MEDDYRIPAGVSERDAVAELAKLLRDPDPAVRDDLAYTTLASLIPRLDPGLCRELGDEMAGRFDDPEIHVRSFAPLILAPIVKRGEFSENWLDAFVSWYPAERDLRGWDETFGWLHAAAHGADLLGVFGRCPQVDPTAMLRLAVVRMLAPTEFLFAEMEDARLAAALARTLSREELSEEQSAAWLAPIVETFENGEPGHVPTQISNTVRVLQALYVYADRGVRTGWEGGDTHRPCHPDTVKLHVGNALALAAPYLA
jgi:hypothetical protein